MGSEERTRLAKLLRKQHALRIEAVKERDALQATLHREGLEGCPAIGVGGIHSEEYADRDGGPCQWCGQRNPGITREELHARATEWCRIAHESELELRATKMRIAQVVSILPTNHSSYIPSMLVWYELGYVFKGGKWVKP